MEDLKNRLHEEKKIIKEILKETNFSVELETPYKVSRADFVSVYSSLYKQEFEEHILDDSRSSSLDKGNIKLTYESVSNFTATVVMFYTVCRVNIFLDICILGQK